MSCLDADPTMGGSRVTLRPFPCRSLVHVSKQHSQALWARLSWPLCPARCPSLGHSLLGAQTPPFWAWTDLEPQVSREPNGEGPSELGTSRAR